jgi:hypothetical protein
LCVFLMSAIRVIWPGQIILLDFIRTLHFLVLYIRRRQILYFAPRPPSYLAEEKEDKMEGLPVWWPFLMLCSRISRRRSRNCCVFLHDPTESRGRLFGTSVYLGFDLDSETGSSELLWFSSVPPGQRWNITLN